jgi:hypothetical protein
MMQQYDAIYVGDSIGGPALAEAIRRVGLNCLEAHSKQELERVLKNSSSRVFLVDQYCPEEPSRWPNVGREITAKAIRLIKKRCPDANVFLLCGDRSLAERLEAEYMTIRAHPDYIIEKIRELM